MINMENLGININVIKTNKFKTTCITFLLKQKLDREKVTYNALLSKILMLGCEKYKSIKEINLKSELMFGTTFHIDILKKGENQIIEVFCEFISNKVNLYEILEFFKNILLEPLVDSEGFLKENFERAKQLVKDDILSRQNDKKRLAKERCIEIMCKDERFSILADGYIEDFDKIDRKTLYSHYREILKHSEIDVVAIGNLEENLLKKCIFEKFNVGNRVYKKYDLDFIFKTNIEVKEVVEKFDVTQGKLCMGLRSNIEAKDKQFLPLLVGNEILGGGSGSFLFNNVREKENLCYYVNSYIYIFKGIVFIESGINFESYKNAKTNIIKNVEMLKRGEFTDEHINIAKKGLYKKYNSIKDYNTAHLDFYFTNKLLNIEKDIDKFLVNIQNVEKEQIVKAFNQIKLDTCYFMKGE